MPVHIIAICLHPIVREPDCGYGGSTWTSRHVSDMCGVSGLPQRPHSYLPPQGSDEIITFCFALRSGWRKNEDQEIVSCAGHVQ